MGTLATPINLVNNVTPKRKRGRPPKPNNFSNKITKTINISINTSPLSNLPTAEKNSNLIVKQGVPDIFTPTMRVSPTSRVKKRHSKKSRSISSVDSINDSPISKPDGIINSKTLDNMSRITNGSVHGEVLTPPPTVKADKVERDFLLPATMRNDKNEDFELSLKLMIDDSGKAVLQPPDRLIQPSSATAMQTLTNLANYNVSGVHQNLGANQFPPITNNVSSYNRSMSYSMGVAEEKPRLFHSNSVIGIESNYLETMDFDYGQAPNQKVATNLATSVARPTNTFYSDSNPPQTPKKEYNVSSGFTPLAYSLTPQFNSMMNSIFTSPKKVNLQYSYQDFFMSPSQPQPALSQPGLSQLGLSQPANAFGNYFNDLQYNYSEDGDARQALKKMIHVKRKQ